MKNPNQYSRMSQADPYKEIESLRAKVKELEAKNSSLKEDRDDCLLLAKSNFGKMLAEQAKVMVLTDAIRFWMKAEGDYDMIKAGKKFTEALATVKEMK